MSRRGRFAPICTGWTQRRKVLLLVRSVSASAADKEGTLKELAERPFTSTTPEPLFGIAPRKVRNVEDEDFVSSSAIPPPGDPSLAPHHNYFSQTWAEQKHGSLLKVSDPLDEQSDLLNKKFVSRGPSMPALFSHYAPSHRSAPSRVWLVAPDLQSSNQDTFTFTSFKVLASQVAHKHKSQLFRHVPFEMLAWKSRSRKIVAALELCSADVICLQEVDRFRELQSRLSWKGYAGLYKATTGTEPYGCAIFWRQERFQLLHEESLEFSLLGMRDNVAQLCVLQLTVPETVNMGATSDSGNLGPNQRKRLIVGNIDVCFNPKRGHIKLGQCRAFLQQAHRLSTLWPGAPLIIGGCFQLTPQSAAYDFLANSMLDVYGLECQHLSGQGLVPANSPRRAAKHLGEINTTSSGKGEPSLDLRNHLRKSLPAKFASKQETHAMDLAKSSKELVSSTSSLVSSSALVSNDRRIYKNEHNSVKKFVSKTIGILESSIDNSQSSSKSMVTNSSEVDVAVSISKVMDTCTPPANGSTSSGLVKVFGSKLELPCKSEAPEQRSLCGLDGTLTEPCSVFSSDCAGVLCDKTAPASTLSGDSTKANILNCTSTDPPGQATPDHGWDPEELKLATGFADRTMVKHKLKLFSVYPEITGNSKTRDDKGEPHVTMCHREFRGTVDYIWRSEGLRTEKVLDAFSLTDIMATPALPFMDCGSDHIYLACELAFTSD